MSATVADRLVAAHNSGSADVLASCYAPGASVFVDGWSEPADVPTWLSAMEALHESFPDVTFSRQTWACGDGVTFAEVRIAGTNTGPLNLGATDRIVLGTDAAQLPPTGRAFEIVGIVVLEHTGDAVTKERQYWPATGWLEQLGLLP